MSKKKSRRRREGPMPAASAGLIRFYQDDSPGIHVGPGAVVLISVSVIIAVVIGHLYQQGLIPLP